MWIFRNDSFISVVAHRDQPENLLARSRIEGDIERAFPAAEVFQVSGADYRYRAVISRQALKDSLDETIDEIGYPNFKNSIKDHRRHRAYSGVWAVLAQEYGAFLKTENP
jgi:hypothetical protein